MKNFSWRGISLDGSIIKGKSLVKSKEELSNNLMTQGISLISHKEINKESLFTRNFFSKKTINLELQISFFSSISIFLENGIDLITSLEIFNQEQKNLILKKIVNSLITDLKNGSSFSNALKNHSSIFKSQISELVSIGEQTSSLSKSLQKIALYQSNNLNIKQNIRKILLMPFITICSSLLITIILFIFIVPQFESFFMSLNKPIPKSTRIVIQISAFLRSEKIVILLAVFIPMFFIINLMFKKLNKKVFNKLIYRLPYLSEILINYDLINFLESLTLFLESGKTLKESMNGASALIINEKMKLESFEIKNEILNGKSFTQALKKASTQYYPSFLRSSILIGENSGRLSHMLKQAANHFRAKMDKQINFLITIFTPVITLILGIFIAILMVSLYMPIFNLSTIF